jgi:hypothetical protein
LPNFGAFNFQELAHDSHTQVNVILSASELFFARFRSIRASTTSPNFYRETSTPHYLCERPPRSLGPSRIYLAGELLHFEPVRNDVPEHPFTRVCFLRLLLGQRILEDRRFGRPQMKATDKDRGRKQIFGKARIPMKAHRLWIEIAMIGTAIACALALLLATLGALGGAAVEAFGQSQAASAEETHDGVVTCSQCGAKHSSKIGLSAADCTRACVHGGAHFALVDGEKIYQLEGDLAVLKKVAGQRVQVVGVVSGNTIHVSSLHSES